MGECSATKRKSIFRKGHKISRDVAQDPSALANLKELGHMTTPVIVVDGAVIVGFAAEKIDRALYGYLSSQWNWFGVAIAHYGRQENLGPVRAR